MSPWPALKGADWVVFGLLVILGTAWAFTRGGQDFNVFYTAAQHIRNGHPENLYTVSPDRFLYAPGFAWLLAPFAALSLPVALGLWTALKTALAAWVIGKWKVQLRKPDHGLSPSVTTALALLITARFWLIDFQYGQINLILFSVASLAIVDLARLKNSTQLTRSAFLSWAALGAVSMIKPLTAPLGLALLAHVYQNRKQRSLLLAPVVGGAIVAAIPAVALGNQRGWTLYLDWYRAIQEKGLPLYTHNQSFVAFLHRFFGSTPSRPVFSPEATDYSAHLLSASTITLLGGLWAAGVLIWLAVECTRLKSRLRPAKIIALLPLPHYLVWKPYLIFTFPAVMSVLQVVATSQKKYMKPRFAIACAFYLFSGFDVVGVKIATVLESFSVFLWAGIYFAMLAED